MLLGDDDVLGPDVIHSFYEAIDVIKSEQISVLRFASVAINDIGDQTSPVYEHPQLELATDAYYKNFKNEGRSSLSEYIFKREAYQNKGFRDYPLGWFSDDMAWLEFSDYGDIFSINKARILVRTSQYSITGQDHNFNEKYKAAYLFFCDIIGHRPRQFNANQRKDFVLQIERMMFKLKLMSWSGYFIIATFG